MKNRIAVMSLAAGVVAGGVAGLALGITNLAGAASGPTPTTSTPGTSGPSTGSAPKSNEDATHEQNENPTREADENAGRVGRHHGMHNGLHRGDNENTSHDSTETPQREAQEDARTNTTPAPSATAPSTPAPGI
jgi:hypothetical protein